MTNSNDEQNIQSQSQQDNVNSVGYCSPPKHSQFKKGRSGNPNGRPKGAKNKPTLIDLQGRLRMAFDKARVKKVPIKRAGGTVEKVSMDEAVIESIGVQAMKGKPYAQRLYTDIAKMYDEEDRKTQEEWITYWAKYKNNWTKELQRRERSGQTHLKPPIPHPDNVLIDTTNCTIKIRGPIDERAIKEREFYRKQLQSNKEEMIKLRKDLATYSNDPDILAIIKDDIKSVEKTIPMLEELVGNDDDELEPWEIYEKYT